MSTIDYACNWAWVGQWGATQKSNILLLNYTGLTWSPPMKQRRGSWICLDWLWGFATHQPVDYCGWNFTILLSYTPMMSAFYGLKRAFSGLTLEFSGWKQGGFLPHHTWSISPIGWFLSSVFSLLAARWISLDLNADHYPTATGLQWGGMLMIDGGCWELYDSYWYCVTMCDVLVINYPMMRVYQPWPTFEMEQLVHLWEDSYQKRCLSTRRFGDRR